MIRAVFSMQGDSIVAAKVCGHALFAPVGEDIVCAAVSALTIALANGLEREKVPCDIQSDAETGLVTIKLASSMDTQVGQIAQALMKTLYEGLKDVAAASGAQHVMIAKIQLEEVDTCSQ